MKYSTVRLLSRSATFHRVFIEEMRESEYVLGRPLKRTFPVVALWMISPFNYTKNHQYLSHEGPPKFLFCPNRRYSHYNINI